MNHHVKHNIFSAIPATNETTREYLLDPRFLGLRCVTIFSNSPPIIYFPESPLHTAMAFTRSPQPNTIAITQKLKHIDADFTMIFDSRTPHRILEISLMNNRITEKMTSFYDRDHDDFPSKVVHVQKQGSLINTETVIVRRRLLGEDAKFDCTPELIGLKSGQIVSEESRLPNGKIVSTPRIYKNGKLEQIGPNKDTDGKFSSREPVLPATARSVSRTWYWTGAAVLFAAALICFAVVLRSRRS